MDSNTLFYSWKNYMRPLAGKGRAYEHWRPHNSHYWWFLSESNRGPVVHEPTLLQSKPAQSQTDLMCLCNVADVEKICPHMPHVSLHWFQQNVK